MKAYIYKIISYLERWWGMFRNSLNTNVYDISMCLYSTYEFICLLCPNEQEGL